MRVTASVENKVAIIGAGIAGLACARHLRHAGLPLVLLEAKERIGGRIKTDRADGYLLNHGFQVLQTAYPEAQKILNFERLSLKSFAPGAIIRTRDRFYRVSDPRRRPKDLWRTLSAPIGTVGDRLRILRLTGRLLRTSAAALFETPDFETIDYLRSEGFSEKIIQTFFKPFFAGVCLDPDIKASSNVFKYVYRIFAAGDVALPAQGMGAIADQLAEDLPSECIRTGTRAVSLNPGEVILTTGETIEASAVVIATEGPETARLLNNPLSVGSRGEWCLYFGADKPPVNEPYLILNGTGTGWVNSVTVPSVVAPAYAPEKRALVSVVVIENEDADRAAIERNVRNEMREWFGPDVDGWRHIRTYRIDHALPEQPPTMPNPEVAAPLRKDGFYICGEYGSVPGIQWALLSGRRAAEQVLTDFEIE